MTDVSLERVTKRYDGARAAVDGVSLDVVAGEIVVLLGPSGCGKTTLLKTVNRMVEIDEGTVRVGGRDVRELDPIALRRGIGYVIQSGGLFPHWSVARNVGAVPTLLGWSAADVRARVDELLALVGLDPDEYRDRRPAALSGGQQQRVGIARALAARPTLLLMDEPFGALDAVTRAGLQDELLRLESTLEQTVLFVTHDVDEALRLAHRVVVMRDGRIVQVARPIELLASPADDGVRALVGADDAVRRLALAHAGDVVEHRAVDASAPRVRARDDLRTVLSVLLSTGAREAAVVSDGGDVVGAITLDRIAERARA